MASAWGKPHTTAHPVHPTAAETPVVTPATTTAAAVENPAGTPATATDAAAPTASASVVTALTLRRGSKRLAPASWRGDGDGAIDGSGGGGGGSSGGGSGGGGGRGDGDGGDETGSAAPLLPLVTAKREPPPPPSPPPKSHTKKCRDKVNAAFAALLGALPPPPPGGAPLRHKADILDYVAGLLRGLAADTERLEARLALAAPARLVAWAGRVAAAAGGDLPAALPRLAPALTVKAPWALAEWWEPTAVGGGPGIWAAVEAGEGVGGEEGEGAGATILLRLTSSVAAMAKDEVVAADVAAFSVASAVGGGWRAGGCRRSGGGSGGGGSSSSGSGVGGSGGGVTSTATSPTPLGIVRPPDDLVGRVYTTRRPEWMGDLARTADVATFRRAGLARKHGLDVAVGVPVVVGGVVLGVLVLLDTEWRRYEPALTSLAADVGALVAAVWIRDRPGRDGGGEGKGGAPEVPPALIGGLAEAAVASAAALLA
ncbi:hypothetical protein MMPV_005033 [Pyropia vietnamensis]